MENLKGQWIIIQAYMHNGELHREWSHGYVIEDNDDYFAVVSVRASVLESDGRKWHIKEPAIFILSKKEWFNVIAMFKEDNTISYYVNIASPSIFDKGFIKYIDYDLDVKLYGDGTTRLLDVSEYHKHAEEQEYGDDIKVILKSSVDKTYEKISNHVFPFVDKDIKKFYDEFLRETNQK